MALMAAPSRCKNTPKVAASARSSVPAASLKPSPPEYWGREPYFRLTNDPTARGSSVTMSNGGVVPDYSKGPVSKSPSHYPRQLQTPHPDTSSFARAERNPARNEPGSERTLA